MKKIINNISIVILFFAAFTLLTACNDQDFSYGELIKPEIINIQANIKGKSSDKPNGDGTGMVEIIIEANNAINYKILKKDGSSTLAPQGKSSILFSEVGLNHQEITAIAYGTGGLSDTAKISFDLLVSYIPPEDLLKKLVGNGEKTWRIKAEAPKHFGLGPVGGKILSEWYGAGPNEKDNSGMYDDRYIFKADGTFKHITNINSTNESGTIFGRKGLVEEIGTGGEVAGADVMNVPLNDYTSNWQLIAPDNKETIILSGTSFIGYYTGGNHQYQIVDRSTPNEIIIKTTDGNNEFDWWFILVSDDTDNSNTSCNNGYTGKQAGTGQYELIWVDEFNVAGAPCQNNWNFDLGTGENGWGNNEAQTYTKRLENVRIEDGKLKITAKRENFEGSNFTSARIKTQDKFEFTYGKLEVKAKLPINKGTWPAIWMLGANFPDVGWPQTGEIDIMEHVGKTPHLVMNTIHTPSSYANSQNHAEFQVDDVTQFHIYSMEWTPNEIMFYTDGNLTYTYSPTTKNNETWPFNKDQFIILNMAMGGNLGGEIPASFNEATMEIDYVKVYQK